MCLRKNTTMPLGTLRKTTNFSILKQEGLFRLSLCIYRFLFDCDCPPIIELAKYNPDLLRNCFYPLCKIPIMLDKLNIAIGITDT